MRSFRLCNTFSTLLISRDAVEKSSTRLHNSADARAARGRVHRVPVPHYHRLVAVLTVPRAAAALQVVGRCFLKLHLLLLPNQQRCVFVPETSETLRHGLLSQRKPLCHAGRCSGSSGGSLVRDDCRTCQCSSTRSLNRVTNNLQANKSLLSLLWRHAPALRC